MRPTSLPGTKGGPMMCIFMYMYVIHMCRDPLATVIGLGFSTLPKTGYPKPSLTYFLEPAKKIWAAPGTHFLSPTPHDQ